MREHTGRPMKAVADPGSAIGRLASRLREARSRRVLSRADIAELIGCSESTIQRAEAGRTPPTLAIIQGYARVCGLDSEELLALRLAARRTRGGTARRSLTQAPSLKLVRSVEDLGAALVRAYELNDRPSARVMAQRAERRYRATRLYAPLSRSTAWRIATRKSLPASADTLRAYLLAVGVAERAFPDWVSAWNRVRERERRRELRGRAAEAAEVERRTLNGDPAEAERRMRAAGLVPVTRYPGFRTPWAARCERCGSLSRYRLARVVENTERPCPACRRTTAATDHPAV
ncbi:helix-turn-helix domain-containing protein [Streptomyces sp. DT24]|uniref:helix-turn-helix domain-containing protein n=1 Tax=unclassified Streptomyces TaxID=2593676 RepID=UPI0023B9B494|nr:helix-turn-helix transcriptional regulator [Streptomyces sp. AM 4-1-1]WEH32020.1 helix-turn-helix transcriptional regulator [Streptomyces sp. AM 4-1-1]